MDDKTFKIGEMLLIFQANRKFPMLLGRIKMKFPMISDGPLHQPPKKKLKKYLLLCLINVCRYPDYMPENLLSREK